jgi:exodeoxyribonuclease VII large subunit
MNSNYTYGVSDFVNNIKITLSENFPSVSVLGEVSQINYHEKSGHLYFNIKDDKNSLSCVIWKNNVAPFLNMVKEGEVIKIIGKITIFPNSSKIHLNGIYLSSHKSGDIQQSLIELKNKLSKEGLFDDKHKKTLTKFPKSIGLITSKDGAVIEDIKTTLRDSYPTKLQLINCNMQGIESVKDIIIAINKFNNLADKPSFIIIARGGGSKEDLFHFNNEDMVRAIFNSNIPIITAIGHDSDNSLADLVSSLSKSTPTSSVAWLPKKIDIQNTINNNLELLKYNTKLNLDFNLNKIKSLHKSLLKPKQILEIFSVKINQLNNYLNLYPQGLQHTYDNLSNLKNNLFLYKNHLNKLTQNVEIQHTLLEELSFKKTLSRGFNVLYDTSNNIIKDANNLTDGDYIVELHNGSKSISITNKK